MRNTQVHCVRSSCTAEEGGIYSNHCVFKFRVLRYDETCMGESRDACTVLVGKPEGKRPLERPKRRWEEHIKMDLRRGMGGTD